MISRAPTVTVEQFERETGWALKPEGACQGEVCVPLGAGGPSPDSVDLAAVAERLGMGLVHDEATDLWSLGPATGPAGRALSSAAAPDLELADFEGRPFRLASLHGRKVLLVAWASW